jgi:RNA polymerase sigma factor (sigma-70 family)
MNEITMNTEARASDSDLVTRSLSGDRDAFGQIIWRYQSLICSMAYSAVGSLGHSQDLAQETFISAWSNLSRLSEPSRLRAWLCGIARNLINNYLRREGRTPLSQAQELEGIEEPASPELQPAEQTITREEESILWRSLETVPLLYREPLVLFYRQGHSVQKVAEALELTEDTVKQRLSRGRKLLQEHVIAFVEGALQKSSPGKTFTVGVLAALPAFTMSSKAAVLGMAAAKGGATVKAAAAGGAGGALLSFPLAIFGNYLGYRVGMLDARSDEERNFIRRFYGMLVGTILVFFVAFAALIFLGRPMMREQPQVFARLLIALAVTYGLVSIALAVWTWRARRKLAAALSLRAGQDAPSRTAWEYKSSISLLGWPLIHIRVGGSTPSGASRVKAWFAAGDCAVGLLFAFGGMAVAPVSIGGCAIGLIAFGGSALGPLAMGGFALGVWSFGGLAMGWQAYGGLAIAWNAAIGGAAVASSYALGGFARAVQANNGVAEQFVKHLWFFRASSVLIRYMVWLNFVWVVPMIFWWRAMSRAAVARNQKENVFS